MQKTIEDYGTVIYKCYSGSTSYGTAITEEMAKERAEKEGGDWKDYVSDVDIRGIFIPHPQYLYGMNKVDEFNDPSEEDTVYFSLEKFIRLALECNPNVVEQLFVKDEHVLFMSDIGRELRENRKWFLTKNAYGRFGSYAWSQLQRMETHDGDFQRNDKRMKIIDSGEGEDYYYDKKNAMHLERLFLKGIEILNTGNLHTFRPEWEHLLGIRDGKFTLTEMKERAQRLNTELQEAMENSTIPNVPDFDHVNEWVIGVVEKAHGTETVTGTLQEKTLSILPVEYEMVDQNTLFLVSNPLVRKQSKSDAHGLVVPYRDWFTGLRQFSEFKFDNTAIEHIHKFAQKVYKANPRHLDTIFAPQSQFLHTHPMAEELLTKLKGLPQAKAVYHVAKGYATGNLKKMEHWEKQKEEHERFKKEVKIARATPVEYWGAELYRIESLKEDMDRESYQKEKDEHSKRKNRWEELRVKKKNLPPLPPIEKVANLNASYIGKFGYDTILAYEMVHALRMAIEILRTGTIADSRAYESELYGIKHGAYATFQEFKEHLTALLEELQDANDNKVLTNPSYNDFEVWVMDFIQRYLKTI